MLHLFSVNVAEVCGFTYLLSRPCRDNGLRGEGNFAISGTSPPPRFMNVLKIFSLLGISIQILNVLISCVMWPQLLDEGFPVICVFLYQFFCRLCPLEFAAEANRKNYVKILEIILTISLPAVWFQTFSRLYFFRKISLSVFAGKWNFLLNILKGLLLLN